MVCKTALLLWLNAACMLCQYLRAVFRSQLFGADDPAEINHINQEGNCSSYSQKWEKPTAQVRNTLVIKFGLHGLLYGHCNYN